MASDAKRAFEQKPQYRTRELKEEGKTGLYISAFILVVQKP